MFPFWDLVIWPVIEATHARRVLEIGTLRGETTIRMLDHLGPDAELHVIDPVPGFDPAEHEAAFPGRYLFHRDLSLRVLPTLPPVDVALIDGDHNWYTVYHELKALAATAEAHGTPLPVCLLHDVTWPYGRRDLYYAPDDIPPEHRQPFAQRGIRYGKSELAPGHGGLNPTMNNALTEGGPRNGVMTGVDDFVAEHPRPLKVMVMPIYFGLAIVVEEERLAANPDLATVLARFETTAGKDDLLELAEYTRIRAMLFQHNVFFHRDRQLAAAAQRYLGLLRGALLDDHYLENEVRIDHLLDCIGRGTLPVASMIRDPLRQMKDKTRRLRGAHRTGALTDEHGAVPSYFPWTSLGRTRLERLEACLDDLRTSGTAGDLVECGTGRGGGAVFLRGYLEAWFDTDRTVWVADPFRAGPAGDGDANPDFDPGGATGLNEARRADGEDLPGGGRGFPELWADLNIVREGFDRFDLLDDRVRFLQGELADTLPDAPVEQVALLRIGEGQGPHAADALDALYPRLAVGGYVMVDGYGGDDATTAAVDRWRDRRGVDEPIERPDWVGALWQKQVEATTPDEPGARPTPVTCRVGHRSVAEAPSGACDLSVVVVFYNMAREARRTLHSLSRAYQRDIDDLDYEVIVLDNGSEPDQRLDAAWVASFGPEFRFLDMGADAHPSPVRALNRGIAAARGRNLALMIDGAHVLTPGVLRHGMAGLRTYEPAVVAAQQFYVGPGQQGDAMADGYDQAFEDRLFREIEWPIDGYRLFDVGHFIGERDWFDGMWESNCLFVPRSVLAQVGAFDESFDMPGAGYANLELYERLGSTPGTAVVTILGEGSFHQVHGGTTTNQTVEDRAARIASYAAHYGDLRGRGFRGLDKQMNYVGTMFWEACRTRPRRHVAPNFFKAGTADSLDGRPDHPTPIPQDLNLEYMDAFWRSLRWEQTSWMGRRIAKAPNDLWVYQELLAAVRPGWIIETARGSNGARALYLASLCDVLGHGRVVSVDRKPTAGRPEHPRLTYLDGQVFDADVLDALRDLVGSEPTALAVLGTQGRRLGMIKEFEAVKPFVPVGSYVVMEETILNGHPVWPAFGLGPAEAVRQILVEHRDFVSDITMERYGVTFNPGGFLKRVR